MKAQITLEYLVLSVVFLAVLSFSLLAIYSLKETADKQNELIKFKFEVEKIDSSIKKVCSLGSGNQLPVELSLTLNVSYLEEGIVFMSGENDLPKSYACKVSGEDSISSNILVSNENGEILLTVDQ